MFYIIRWQHLELTLRSTCAPHIAPCLMSCWCVLTTLSLLEWISRYNTVYVAFQLLSFNNKFKHWIIIILFMDSFLLIIKCCLLIVHFLKSRRRYYIISQYNRSIIPFVAFLSSCWTMRMVKIEGVSHNF